MTKNYKKHGSQYGEIAGNIFLTRVSADVSQKGIESYFDTFGNEVRAAAAALKSDGATEDQANTFINAACEAFKPFLTGWLFGKAFAHVK